MENVNGLDWAQAQYDRQEPFLPVCEGETLDLKYEIQALKARIQELEARLND